MTYQLFSIFHNNTMEIITIPFCTFVSAKILSLFVCRYYLPPCWVLRTNIQPKEVIIITNFFVSIIRWPFTSDIGTFVYKITGKVLSSPIVVFKSDLIIIIFFNYPLLLMVVYFLVIISISEYVIVNPSC